MPPGTLQFPGAAGHCVLPEFLAVVVEDELRLLGSGEPVVTCELALKLTGSPAGIAEREQALLGALMMADVEQDLTARRHRHAAVDIDGLGAPIFGAMDDKTEFRLHRAAGEDAQNARYVGVIMTGRLQQGRNRALADRAVYHDPQGALLVVPYHQDDGVSKTRIADRRCRDQQLPGERSCIRMLGRGYPEHDQRRDQRRDRDQASAKRDAGSKHAQLYLAGRRPGKSIAEMAFSCGLSGPSAVLRSTNAALGVSSRCQSSPGSLRQRREPARRAMPAMADRRRAPC